MANYNDYFIWEKGDTGKLSLNFDRSEFTCKGTKCGCTTQKISKQLVEQLQVLRQLCGPLRVTSAYRCRKHNAAVKGSKNSFHVKSMAVDIQPIGDFLAPTFKGAMVKLLQQIEHMDVFNGIGVAKNFIHVDLRKNKVRWGY